VGRIDGPGQRVVEPGVQTVLLLVTMGLQTDGLRSARIVVTCRGHGTVVSESLTQLLREEFSRERLFVRIAEGKVVCAGKVQEAEQ